MRWLKTRRKPSSAWVVFNMFEWVSTYLSLNVYIGFELVHRYTPRHLAEYLPIIVMYHPKIVEKSDLLLKSLESLEPWKCWHVTTLMRSFNLKACNKAWLTQEKVSNVVLIGCFFRISWAKDWATISRQATYSPRDSRSMSGRSR